MKEKGSRKVNFPEAIILLVIVVFIMIYLNRSDSYRSRACILCGLMRNLRQNTRAYVG